MRKKLCLRRIIWLSVTDVTPTLVLEQLVLVIIGTADCFYVEEVSYQEGRAIKAVNIINLLNVYLVKMPRPVFSCCTNIQVHVQN
jgi:hypothetical protein